MGQLGTKIALLTELLIGLRIPVLVISNETEDPKVLTMCALVESNNTELIYDYDKSAAGIYMGLEYVNEFMFAPDFRLRFIETNIGRFCGEGELPHAAAHALFLWENGIRCNVFLGPGRHSNSRPTVICYWFVAISDAVTWL